MTLNLAVYIDVYIYTILCAIALCLCADAERLRITNIPFDQSCDSPAGERCILAQECIGPKRALNNYVYSTSSSSAVNHIDKPCASNEVCLVYIDVFGSGQCIPTQNMTVSTVYANETKYYCKYFSTTGFASGPYLLYSEAVVQMVTLLHRRHISWYNHASTIRSGLTGKVLRTRKSQYTGFFVFLGTEYSGPLDSLNVTICNKLERNRTYKIYTAALRVLEDS